MRSADHEMINAALRGLDAFRTSFDASQRGCSRF